MLHHCMALFATGLPYSESMSSTLLAAWAARSYSDKLSARELPGK